MHRISSNMISDNMNFHLRNREWDLSEIQNKMGSQTRIKNLRDDPMGASHSVRFQSKIFRLERYIDNIDKVQGQINLAEGNIRSAIDIMQRINEIAVQGANGIYGQEETAIMAQEVDQLLHELISIGNAKSEDGLSLFAGFKEFGDAFRENSGPVPGADAEKIVSVDYLGDMGTNKVEISDGITVPANNPGNYAFWAENQQIYSNFDATEYRVQEDSIIKIDGSEIRLTAGDNVFAIVSKINDSDAPIKARMDPVKNSLVLESSTPHQIWVDDLENSTVLKDLGITDGTRNRPPFNISDSARVYGGSVFDMVISLRDGLYEGNTLDIGGSGLRGINDALNNLIKTASDIGARSSRLEQTFLRLNHEVVDLMELNSREVDLDMAEAIMELKMLDYVHNAALSTTAKILKPTLLDFLR